MEKIKPKIEGTYDLKVFIEQQQVIIEEKRAEIFRLKSVIEKLPGSIYWKDKNGTYLGCNEFVLKMAGIRHEKEIVGRTDFNMPWKKYAEKLQAIDQQVLTTEIPVEVEESPVLGDGQQIVMLTHKAPLRDENGEIIGIIGVSVDITERKQMEAKLEDAKDKAELADQTKTAFLENMRHDIRTPLTGIIGCVDILRKEFINPELNEYLENLVASSHALLNLLNEVLEASNINSGEIPLLKRKFNLKTRLEEVIHLNKARAIEKGITLLFEYDETMPQYVIGDSTRIHRIALELVANALNYTEKGHVKLSVKLARRNKRDLVIKLIVEDTGIGIPADKQQEVFLQFKRLTPSYDGIYKGMGLGLSVIKQFMDSIQGEIHLESELQKGTKFTCLIPLREALLDDAFGVEESSQLTHLKKPVIHPLVSKKTQEKTVPNSFSHTPIIAEMQSRILLVEDHPIVAKITKKTLSDLNCLVDIANDGKTALELIEKTYYHLIFMDIGLPDMSGYAVTKRIRSHRLESIREVPIIALTAHVESEEKQQCLDVAMNMVITKPLTEKWAKSVLDTFISQRKINSTKLKQNHRKTLRTEPAIVDFEYAKTLLGGNETMVHKMLAMLMESLPEEVKALEDAYQQKNWENLRSLAHKLKGGASYCGTLRLKSVCTELDKYIKSGLTARIPKLYQKLLSEIQAIQKFMS